MQFSFYFLEGVKFWDRSTSGMGQHYHPKTKQIVIERKFSDNRIFEDDIIDKSSILSWDRLVSRSLLGQFHEREVYFSEN